MSPRKASLRVAHSRSCPNATKTALSSIGKGKRLGCPPSYYVSSRDREGRPEKGARVKDRKTAERALAAAQREIDEGRVGIAKPGTSPSPSGPTSSSRSSTRGSRRASFTPARRAPTRARSTVAGTTFGSLHLCEIGNPELRRYIEPFTRLKPASRLRYLRDLRGRLGGRGR